MANSPTSRTLDWLRKRGYTCQVVERFNKFANVRVDLFGIIDIVAMDPVRGRIIGVQSTSGDNVVARLNKAKDEPRLVEWLSCGGHFEVHGWRKTGARGKRKLWNVRRVIAELEGGVRAKFWETEDDVPDVQDAARDG